MLPGIQVHDARAVSPSRGHHVDRRPAARLQRIIRCRLRPEPSAMGASIGLGHGSSKSSRAVQLLRSRARLFPICRRASFCNCAIRQRRPETSWSSDPPNVAEDLGIPACKAAIIRLQYGGIIGEVLRYIDMQHGYHQLHVIAP